MAAATNSGPRPRDSLQKLLVAAFFGSTIFLFAMPSHAHVVLRSKADIRIVGYCYRTDIPGNVSTSIGEINVLDAPLLMYPQMYNLYEFSRLQGFAVPLFKDRITNRTSVTISGALVFGKNSTTFPTGTRLNIEGTFEVPTNATAVDTDAARQQLTSAVSIVGGTGPLRSASGFVLFDMSYSGYASFQFYVFLAGNGLFVPGADVE